MKTRNGLPSMERASLSLKYVVCSFCVRKVQLPFRSLISGTYISRKSRYILSKYYFTESGKAVLKIDFNNSCRPKLIVFFNLPLQKSSSSARIGLIHNPTVKQTDDQPELLQVARTVEAVLSSKSHVTPAMLTFMEKLLDESNDFDNLSSDSKAMGDLLAKIPVCLYEA